MSYSSIAPVKYFLTILVLLSLFFLISCGETEKLGTTTVPSYMSFALTNSAGVVDTTTALSRASTYVAVIKQESGAPLKTADYDIIVVPENAITINSSSSSNSIIKFTVNNTSARKVTITAKHKKDPGITEILVLELAPPVNLMSFTLSSGGDQLTTNTVLARASTYVVGVKRESDAPLPTADYKISYEPADAIAISERGTNLITFQVKNTAAKSITITATHKDNPGISGTLVLNLADQADFMSFTLTNSRGAKVDTKTPLSRISRYGLTINPAGEIPLQTADYDITFSPENAITGIATNTNAISFIVNNKTATSVTITATHKDNPVITKTLELNFAPQAANFMSFTLTNSRGAKEDTKAILSRASSYGLTIKGEIPLQTADYNITFSPASAIRGLATNTNAMSFMVNNDNTKSVTITVTHKNNPAITGTLELNLADQADFMSFTLTNSKGIQVPTTLLLYPSSSYGLRISRENMAPLPTEDYDITFSPANAITINVTRPNLIDFTVNSSDARSVTIIVTHKDNSVISESLVLKLASVPATPFQLDIENVSTVPDLNSANSLTVDVLGPLGVPKGTPLVKRYVTEAGAGSKDGSSWANAWAGINLRNNINGITDASGSKVYLIMVAGGKYTPGTTRDDSFSMKNYVVIMGGFVAEGGWVRTGTTIFSGDIGIVNDNTDNSYNVFYNSGGDGSRAFNKAHLYGVTISGGNASGGRANGGGMYNEFASPILKNIVFFANNAANHGGGIYNGKSREALFNENNSSSPILINVLFSYNTAQQGGGMYNNSSSPILSDTVFISNRGSLMGGGIHSAGSAINSSGALLNNTVFIGNSAKSGGGMANWGSAHLTLYNAIFIDNTSDEAGGGMYNHGSSPVLKNTVFANNSARGGGKGGGMYNTTSSYPEIIGVVFTSNSAYSGGAMHNDNNDSERETLIVNGIFSGNTTNNGAGIGPDIAMLLHTQNYESVVANVAIAGTVLGIGLSQPTDAIIGYGGAANLEIYHHNLVNSAVNFGADATLTVNGINFTFPTIQNTSSARNLGLFVRRGVSGTTVTHYFSEDNRNWYTGFKLGGGLAGTPVTLPADTEDLTDTDITGTARNGRPDAGVYELP